MSKLLTADQILKVDDLSSEVVPVPEWGGEVRVIELTGEQRDAFGELISKQGKANAHARLAAMTIVDEEGKRVFTDKQISALGAKSGVALKRVSDTALKLSKMLDEDVEDSSENFTNGRNEPSISG